MKRILYAGVLIAAIVASYVAARLTANIVHAQKLDQRLQKSQIQTDFQLQKMGTIAIGDTLPDFEFSDLDGRHIVLSEILTGPTLVLYVEVGCDACIEELLALTASIEETADWQRFLIISYDDPASLTSARDQLKVGCPILYDANRRFGIYLNLSISPFNLYIDSARRILEVRATPLGEEDFKRFLESS